MLNFPLSNYVYDEFFKPVKRNQKHEHVMKNNASIAVNFIKIEHGSSKVI